MDGTWLLYALTVAYGATGFISLAGYLPQFHAYFTKPRTCNDAPITTWVLWSVQGALVFMYAAIINGDIMFILSGVMSVLANFGGLALVLWGRMRARDLRTRAADRPAERKVVVLDVAAQRASA